jgi:5-methylcytosine-specific restriction endonuclease McrA
MQKVRRKELVAAIGTPCRYCGEPMVAPTRDHMLPRRMGGKLWRRNKVLVCTRCNSDKRGRTLLAWLYKLERHGDPRAAIVGAMVEADTSTTRPRGRIFDYKMKSAKKRSSCPEGGLPIR